LGKDNLCKFVVIRWVEIYATLIFFSPVVDKATLYEIKNETKTEKKEKKRKEDKQGRLFIYLYKKNCLLVV